MVAAPAAVVASVVAGPGGDGLEVTADLVGRRTDEIFAAYWPGVTDPSDGIAAALNARPTRGTSWQSFVRRRRPASVIAK